MRSKISLTKLLRMHSKISLTKLLRMAIVLLEICGNAFENIVDEAVQTHLSHPVLTIDTLVKSELRL